MINQYISIVSVSAGAGVSLSSGVYVEISLNVGPVSVSVGVSPTGSYASASVPTWLIIQRFLFYIYNQLFWFDVILLGDEHKHVERKL